MSGLYLLAWSSPTSPDVEDEFNEWYENTHIPQVTELLHVSGKVTRYRDVASNGASRYLAIYPIGDDLDLPTAGQLLGGAASSGDLDATSTMDMTTNPPDMQWFERQA